MPPQSPHLVGVWCHVVTLLSPRLLLTSPVVLPELLLAVRLSWSSCGSLIRQNQLLESRFESRYPGYCANSCLSPTTAPLSQLSFPVGSLFHFSFLWRKRLQSSSLSGDSPRADLLCVSAYFQSKAGTLARQPDSLSCSLLEPCNKWINTV